MRRREFLAATTAAFGTGSVAGCTGRQSPSETTPTDRTTQSTPTSASGQPTDTPVPESESCQSLPDIDGLPDRPAEWTDESVRSYVTVFERAYAVEANPEYRAIDSVRVTHVEASDEGYRVQLDVEGVPATPGTDPSDGTPTPLPVDGRTHRALYRVRADRLVRERRGHAGGRLLTSDCWALPGADAGE